ncbi:glutaredoxin family protein [Marinobacter bryozoorum]|uniref:glutaredoxin family protein n=1 Tax=Marinobacter bryozoorum TaxID=256324 RepID=UPI00200604EB|nr:glutaredoxin family protein [Marinobacter bryozoorum]MCK7545161.1 glutaredoxin family protein [Marinobacter bryozoorum]
MQLTFFTTSHCELCDLAEQLLVNAPLPYPIPVEAVDIATSEELVERYGTRIPVLRREDTGAELGWPFTREQLLDFLGPNAGKPSSGQFH